AVRHVRRCQARARRLPRSHPRHALRGWARVGTLRGLRRMEGGLRDDGARRGAHGRDHRARRMKLSAYLAAVAMASGLAHAEGGEEPHGRRAAAPEKPQWEIAATGYWNAVR